MIHTRAETVFKKNNYPWNKHAPENERLEYKFPVGMANF